MWTKIKNFYKNNKKLAIALSVIGGLALLAVLIPLGIFLAKFGKILLIVLAVVAGLAGVGALTYFIYKKVKGIK